MRYRLDLVLRPAEGALLRVIGMAERRGFSPRAIHGAPDADDQGRWHLQLEVESPRSADTLCRQLEKVYDCESVRAFAIIPHDGPREAAA